MVYTIILVYIVKIILKRSSWSKCGKGESSVFTNKCPSLRTKHWLRQLKTFRIPRNPETSTDTLLYFPSGHHPLKFYANFLSVIHATYSDNLTIRLITLIVSVLSKYHEASNYQVFSSLLRAFCPLSWVPNIYVVPCLHNIILSCRERKVSRKLKKGIFLSFKA